MSTTNIIERSIKSAQASLPKYSNRLGLVYAYIVGYKMDHDGNSPTRREIGTACGIGSTSVVMHNLEKLERAKLIRLAKIGARARSIEVVGAKWLPPEGIE